MRTFSFLTLFMFFSTGIIDVSANTLSVHKVTDSVYALVGELGQRNKSNLGNNATFGVVLTSDGVVLIDAGGTRKGAEQIHALLKTITNKPVVMVINTGGQDQRWLGNGYFKNQGAKVVASNTAVKDQKARFNDQITALENFVGKEGISGTKDVYADKTFESSLNLEIGGQTFELKHSGPAHTPGDIYVWLPDKKIVFTGDIVYTERILVVGPMSNSRSWLESFREIERLDPQHVIPGHGKPTTIQKARADTFDYLMELRKKIWNFTKNGGSPARVNTIDQSRFSYLENFELAKGRNAERVSQELEWE